MNKIVLIVGPSGSGKTATGKELEKHGFGQLVSFTTRPMRMGEVPGEDYYFVSKAVTRLHDIVESTIYNDNMYGLTRTEVESKLRNNDAVYFVTDRNGAEQMIEKYPEEVAYIWLDVSPIVMQERMEMRGDEVIDIRDRIAHAQRNLEFRSPEEEIATDNFLRIDVNETTIEENAQKILEFIGGY